MIKHRRKLRSLRLKDYDYSQGGAYFVTICTKDRQNLFGHISGESMINNSAGQMVEKSWYDLPNHYRCELGEFIVMPNHVHGVIIILDKEQNNSKNPVGAGLKPAPTVGLPEIVRALKTFSARRINEQQRSPGRSIWQRGYYDHIIRDEEGIEKITEYIRCNPIRWAEDRNNPLNKKK